MRAPSAVPELAFPHLNEYHIKTRLVVEMTTSVGEDGTVTVTFGSGPGDIASSIDNVHEIYADLGLYLDVWEISYVSPMPVESHVTQSKAYPDMLSIIFMLKKPGINYRGLASSPWQNQMESGILMSHMHQEWTLAHEVGHYFGLVHTFSEDFVDDTPIQLRKNCSGEQNVKPNCRNIMNYCDHWPKYATPGQLYRMRRFLRSPDMRGHIVVREKPTVNLMSTLLHLSNQMEK